MFNLVVAATNSVAIHSHIMAWLAMIAKHQPHKFNLIRLNPPCSAMDMATCNEKELDEIINAARSYLIQQPAQTSYFLLIFLFVLFFFFK